MRILGLPGGSTACDYYRVLMPLLALHETGLAETYIVPLKDGSRMVRSGDLNDEDRAEIYEDRGAWDALSEIRRFEALPNILDYDLLVFQRQNEESVYKLITHAQKRGIKTIFDIDDDAFSIPPSNPNYMIWGNDGRKLGAIYEAWDKAGTLLPKWRGLTPQEAAAKARGLRDGLFRNIRQADMVTTTTPALVEAYSRLRPDLVILPNEMHPPHWEGIEPIEHPGEIWVGWAGGWTHFDDLKILQKVIPVILERYPLVCFAIAGFPQAKEMLFKDCPDSRVKGFPWTDLNGYKRYMASFDIILAPSYRNTFNAGKSDIRILEAGMVSRPVVGSPTTYGPTIKKSGGGFVAKKWIDWVKAIGRLIEDEALRAQMGATLSDYVLSNRTYQGNAHLWEQAYSRLLEA